MMMVLTQITNCEWKENLPTKRRGHNGSVEASAHPDEKEDHGEDLSNEPSTDSKVTNQTVPHGSANPGRKFQPRGKAIRALNP